MGEELEKVRVGDHTVTDRESLLSEENEETPTGRYGPLKLLLRRSRCAWSMLPSSRAGRAM